MRHQRQNSDILPTLKGYPIYTSFLNFPLISMGALDSLGLDANQGR